MRKLIIFSFLTLSSAPAMAQPMWQQPNDQAKEASLTPEMLAHQKAVDALIVRVNELKREDAAEHQESFQEATHG
jgi:hypothetical protein